MRLRRERRRRRRRMPGPCGPTYGHWEAARALAVAWGPGLPW
jgi:hypothetical protein